MLLAYLREFTSLTVLSSPTLLIIIVTDINKIINIITEQRNNDILVENLGVTSKLKTVNYQISLASGILSFVGTVSILALVLWTDFGILSWSD